MKQIIVISADKEIMELAVDCGFEVHGFLDPKIRESVLGFSWRGEDSDFEKLYQSDRNLRVALAIDPCAQKEKLYSLYEKSVETLVSCDAFISPSASVGRGSLIQRGVKIMADAKVGLVCKANVNALVHHDCRVGNFCTLAPGSILLGRVEVGDRVYIGSGSIVLPRRKIGSDVVIGAGAVVTHDIPAGTTVVGVPARACERA